MTVLVDTSVGSLALRRDSAGGEPEGEALKDAFAGADLVVTTGLVLQELLQGFSGPKAASSIVERFSALPLINPQREDHVSVDEIRNICPRAGGQLGTADAPIAQLCISKGLTLLTTDPDFPHAAKHIELKVWSPQGRSKRDR